MKLRSITFALALAACSNDKAATGQAQPAAAAARKPCAYLVRADAEAALELPLPGTTETEGTGECIYHTAEFYGVAVSVGTWDGVSLAANSGGPQDPAVRTAGLGDEAVTHGGYTYVRKGNRGLRVGINGPAVDGDEVKLLARERALAMKILPSL